MSLKEKIKEIAERLDKEVPCPISGQCFTEVMSSEAAQELIYFICDEAGQNSSDLFGLCEAWWREFTEGVYDNQG